MVRAQYGEDHRGQGKRMPVTEEFQIDIAFLVDGFEFLS